MKKFLFKIFIFIIIVMGLIYALSTRWRNTQAYLLIDEKYRTINPPRSLDVINVGSSHGMTNFEYDSLPSGYTGYNFGRSVQTFEYDLKMIKQNSSRMNDGCVVFVPISYFSFHQRYEDEEVTKFEYTYYNFLSAWQIKNVSLKMLIEYKWFPILDIKKEQLKYLIYDDKNAIAEYDKVFENNRLIDEKTGGIDQARLIKERDKTVAQHAKYLNDGVNIQAVEALKELIKYCENKGYKCILITTPFSEIYNQAEEFDENFFDNFYGIIDDIAQEYSVDYWDYSHDAKYSEDIYLFYDDDHLNHQGRRLFSEDVITRAFNEGYFDE